MPKGYWIVHVDIRDVAAYARYQAANALAFGKYGARFLARGGEHEVVEGKSRTRHVILEFPSYQAALDCYRSLEYQAAKALRDGAGEGDFVVIAGYEGSQPG
jgi:uncharacterized protein (DUF1330 family)